MQQILLETTDLEAELVRCKLESRPIHLLLGNGFSVGYSFDFSYPSLFEIAQEYLTPRLREIFAYLGTNNFEGVLKQLRILQDINQIYLQGSSDCCREVLAEFARDFDQLKRALVNTVTHIHPPYEQFSVDSFFDSSVDHTLPWVDFFKQFNSIFTTNYDLLLYWLIIGKKLTSEMSDGFAKSSSIDGRLEWSENAYFRPIGVYYLHGALHLYRDENGRVLKRTSRSTTRLLEQIKNGIQSKKFPLFVAEGLAHHKKRQIEGNKYLMHCYRQLSSEISGSLVVFGHALRESDDHILDAICGNSHLDDIWLGVYDYHGSSAVRKDFALLYERILEKRFQMHPQKPLRILLYETSQKNYWGAYSKEAVFNTTFI